MIAMTRNCSALRRGPVAAGAAGQVSNTRLIDSTNIGDGSLATVMPEHVGFEKAFVAAWNGQ